MCCQIRVTVLALPMIGGPPRGQPYEKGYTGDITCDLELMGSEAECLLGHSDKSWGLRNRAL